ncbi:Putative Genomic scaffold, msy_sf_23 [Rhizopus microsporus]|nr:Putative Genomic scaffold, msy_sf_23 [Rhizopus microsporus]
MSHSLKQKTEGAVEVNEDIAELVSGTRGKQVFVKRDPDLGIWTAGQVLGLIDDIPTCHQLVTRMIDEAEMIISQRLRNMIA